MASTLKQDLKSVRNRLELLRTTKIENAKVRNSVADAEHCLTRALDDLENQS